MAFDDHRVRIELCDAIGANFSDGSAGLSHYHAAEIWLRGKEPGTISRARRPQIILAGITRVEVLRQLVTWLEENPDDTGLTGLHAAIEAEKAAGR